jgi:hypothetical protein
MPGISSSDVHRSAALAAFGPRSRRSARACSALAAALFSALLVGCAWPFSHSGPTDVASGRYYAAGHPRFDGFFVRLYEAQLRMARAPDDVAASQARLARALSLDPAPDDELLEKLRRDAREYADRGLRMRLRVAAPASDDRKGAGEALVEQAELETNRPPEEESARTFQTAVERAANELLALANDLERTKLELERMQVAVVKLEADVDQAFQREGPAKKSAVRANLSDALKVLPLMVARARSVAEESRGFVGELAAAVETDAPPAPEPRAPPEPPAAEAGPKPVKNRAAKGKPRGAAPRPPPPSKPPAPPPQAPKPPGGAEFEP